jgi:hypothetical protein
VSGEFQEGRNGREETRVGRLPKLERLPVITSCSVHQIILRIFYFIFYYQRRVGHSNYAETYSTSDSCSGLLFKEKYLRWLSPDTLSFRIYLLLLLSFKVYLKTLPMQKPL